MALTSGNVVGGILGSNLFGGASTTLATDDSRLWLDRCSSQGTITDYAGNNAAFMGGLIGFMRGSDTITNSYSKMTMSSADTGLGGLAGVLEPSLNNEKQAIIAHSYFAGTISGASGDRGLLIGTNVGAWNGTFTGLNGIHLVHNKIESNLTYGKIGSGATSNINVINDSDQVFTNLPADWYDPNNFSGWSGLIWNIVSPMLPELF